MNLVNCIAEKNGDVFPVNIEGKSHCGATSEYYSGSPSCTKDSGSICGWFCGMYSDGFVEYSICSNPKSNGKERRTVEIEATTDEGDVFSDRYRCASWAESGDDRCDGCVFFEGKTDEKITTTEGPERIVILCSHPSSKDRSEHVSDEEKNRQDYESAYGAERYDDHSRSGRAPWLEPSKPWTEEKQNLTEDDIQSIAYRVFELIENNLKNSIIHAIEEHLK